VLKEKEERAFGEYRTRRLVLDAWDRLEAELGPVVVRNYREEMAATPGRVAETGPTYQATVRPATPAPPRFGAIQALAPAAKPAPAPRAEPETDAGQPDLFGAPVASSRAEPARAAPKPEPAAPPLVVPVMPAPQGAYPARLAQVMALRKQSTPEAIGTLVAALGDPDANIRWLAALTLKGIGGRALEDALRALIADPPSEIAREEAIKLLGQLEEGGA
jgi:hypothetical protein